jgi:uncharacterized protein
MTAQAILVLIGAGFLGGMANSMAGGASLITFPAMMAAGLAPIPANASNTVALIFGNLMGAWTERQRIPQFDAALYVTSFAAVVGGLLGAILLLNTPEKLFVLVVPWLIGIATTIFAFSRRIQLWLVGRTGARGGLLQAGLIVPTAVYGGYFGAGLGVILMAVLSATNTWELRKTNAVKNIIGVLTNTAAVVIFVSQGVVSWPQTLVMMGACTAGGFAGGKALNFISVVNMRKAIIVIGTAMTLFYGWRFWF